MVKLKMTNLPGKDLAWVLLLVVVGYSPGLVRFYLRPNEPRRP
jgi:hypothetical protein